MLSSRHSRPLTLALAIAAAAFVPSRTVAAQDVFDAKTAGYIRNSYLADLDTLDQERDALAGHALASPELGAQQWCRIDGVGA